MQYSDLRPLVGRGQRQRGLNSPEAEARLHFRSGKLYTNFDMVLELLLLTYNAIFEFGAPI